MVRCDSKLLPFEHNFWYSACNVSKIKLINIQIHLLLGAKPKKSSSVVSSVAKTIAAFVYTEKTPHHLVHPLSIRHCSKH